MIELQMAEKMIEIKVMNDRNVVRGPAGLEDERLKG